MPVPGRAARVHFKSHVESKRATVSSDSSEALSLERCLNLKKASLGDFSGELFFPSVRFELCAALPNGHLGGGADAHAYADRYADA